jgi:hypothetical protein
VIALDLATLANLAEIIGTLTVIGGAVFGIIQLREYRSQRRDTVAVELVSSFQNADVARALAYVRELPDDCSLDQIRSRNARDIATRIATFYEAIGLLTFRRIVPFSIVRELTGGICVVAWRKLERWTLDERKELSQDSFAEWFQWLAERLLESDDDKNSNPAYRRHAAWRPRG